MKQNISSLHWKIKNNNKIITRDNNILKNFRNNGLNYGFENAHFDKLSDTQKNDLVIDLIKVVGKDFFYKSFNNLNIGKTKYFKKMNDKKIIFSEFNFIFWLYEINQNLNLNKIKYICEIGSGFGGLVQKFYLHKDHYKFLIIDLKHSLYVTEFFLKKNFPQKRIIVIDDTEEMLTKKIFDNYDVIICDINVNFHGIKNIDLFINARSFAEMTYGQISNYFDFIHKSISENGYLVNINRYSKRSVGYDVDFCFYPYDDYWKKILIKKSWKQDSILFLITKRTKTKINNMKILKKEILKESIRLKKTNIKNLNPKNFSNIFSYLYYFSLNLFNLIIFITFPYKIYIKLSLLKKFILK